MNETSPTGPGSPRIEDVLANLRLPLRGVVQRVDAAMLPAFDAVYEDGTADLVDLILNDPAERDAISGEQQFGLKRGAVIDGVVALLINVAATVAVERCHHDLPAFSAWVVGAPAQASEPVDKLVCLLQGSPAERERVAAAIRADPKLMGMLGAGGPP